jgi:hypothetical protein
MIAMSGDIYVSQEYLKAHFDGSCMQLLKPLKKGVELLILVLFFCHA